MDLFHVALVSATLLVSLVAGLVFTFACVAMPGIGTLGNREFLHSFQVMDRVIQNNQPLFMLVWVGSVVTLLFAGLLGVGRLEGLDRALLLGATVIYIGGVQVPTAKVNVPLNNQIQTIDLETAHEAALVEARSAFEPRWNRWNQIRTLIATLTAAMLIVVALRL